MDKNIYKKTNPNIFHKNWDINEIGEIIHLNYGKSLKESERSGNKYPVFGSNGVVGRHDKFLVEGPGIIIGRKGTVGSVNWTNENFWPIDTTYYVDFIKKQDVKFWYYFLINCGLDKMNTHSAVPGLNRDIVYSIKKPIPPVEYQKYVSKILSDLDDKIELNNKMNRTLEKIAQAIFKHWFIDFEFPCLPDNYPLSGAREPEKLKDVCTYKAVGGLPIPENGKYFVYVLLCANESFYIGITDDLYRRWYEHKTGQGAKWTKANEPIKVIHYEEFNSRSKAAEREKWLKTGFGRKWLKREYEKLMKIKAGSHTHEVQVCRLRQAGKMVDSELGKIPGGWRVIPIKDTLEMVVDNRGKTPPLSTSGKQLIEVKNIKKNLLYPDFYSSNPKFVDESIYSSWFRDGHPKYLDILFATVGSINNRCFVPPNHEFCIAQNLVALRTKKDIISPFYLYYYLFTESFESGIQGTLVTTVQESIRLSDAMKIKIVLPNKEIMGFFHSILEPLFLQIFFNAEQNQTLSQLRDSLLPRLLSGKISL